MNFVVRPKVPMYCLEAVPYVCALGICNALGGALAWPYKVICRDGSAITFIAHGACDDEGVFVRLELTSKEALSEDALAAMRACVAAWEESLTNTNPVAGPLAPILDDYVGALEAFGKKVEILFSNRKASVRGTLCGIDVWGRATVQLEDGHKLEVVPSQAAIRMFH